MRPWLNPADPLTSQLQKWGSKDAHNPSVEEIFAEALRLPTPEDRAAYLKQACGKDEPMRRRVEALLQDHDHAGGFLDNPPAAVFAKTLAITTGMVPLTEKPGDTSEERRVGKERRCRW